MNLFSYTEAKQRRDAGIEEVIANNKSWCQCAYENVLQLHPSLPEEFTSNDIRRLISPFLGQPKSNNAWGALMRTLSKHIQWTGEVVNSERPTSHHRFLKVYTWKK